VKTVINIKCSNQTLYFAVAIFLIRY